MKHRVPYLLICGLLVSLSLVGCHKVCTCIDYGSREHEFTVEEVDNYAGGNCSLMTEFPIPSNYSYCHW